jgi:dihydrofolate synthase/folylpolyglutamate synthase
VLLDVAHTRESCTALAALARWLFGDRRLVLLAGLTRERSVADLFSPFLGAAAEAVFTAIPNPRTADASAAAAAWTALGGRGAHRHDPLDALALARSLAGGSGAVVVAGSFYLAGEVRPALRDRV